MNKFDEVYNNICKKIKSDYMLINEYTELDYYTPPNPALIGYAKTKDEMDKKDAAKYMKNGGKAVLNALKNAIVEKAKSYSGPTVDVDLSRKFTVGKYLRIRFIYPWANKYGTDALNVKITEKLAAFLNDPNTSLEDKKLVFCIPFWNKTYEPYFSGRDTYRVKLDEVNGMTQNIIDAEKFGIESIKQVSSMDNPFEYLDLKTTGGSNGIPLIANISDAYRDGYKALGKY